MKKFLVLVAVFAGVLLSLGVAGAASLMEKDTLVLGTEGTYPPFEYYDTNNNLVGYDIDVVNGIAKRLGKKIEIIDMAFDGLIPSLLTGKIDMIAAGLANTAERKQKVDFSSIYNVSLTSFITRTDDDRIKGLDDLKDKTVGVQIGSTQDFYVSGLGIPMEIKRYQKNDDTIREVVLGRNDCVAINSFVGASYIENDKFKGQLKVSFKQLVNKPDEGIAIAIRKDDPEFLEAINMAIKDMEDSGELKALKAKYNLD